jgi:hypothetical protein
MDVNALLCYGNSVEERRLLAVEAAENVKRTHFYPDLAHEQWLDSTPSLYTILPFVEFKTAWHPIGV